MIEYTKGAYGLNLMLRVHGSAVWKATLPGILSALLYLLIAFRWSPYLLEDENYAFNHPYAIGVFVTSVTFLIVFRANNGYQRYWEACGAVHHMMSKWMDAVTHTGVYHLQCDHYLNIKPPSYFDYPELNKYNLVRERECPKDLDSYSTDETRNLRRRRRVERSVEFVQSDKKRTKAARAAQAGREGEGRRACEWQKCSSVTHSHQLKGPPRLDGGWGTLFPDDPYGPRATYYSYDDTSDEVSLLPIGIPEGFASTKGGRTHALFLQELCHLASLLVAVCFCTLRNDMEGVENPLDVYRPGEPWPDADPEFLPREVREYMTKTRWSVVKNLKYWFGCSRTPTARARHYASRPMPVIGGVSDAEIHFLQKARGPSAKVTLCWNWLSEFIIREHLAGTLGAVGPPIISRIIQFLSDGMIYYNHARKIMYIPFPFPHAQMSAVFVLFMIPIIPLLMGQYINYPWLGACLTFLTVTCLIGLHEVARELENPFRNVPNDVPLVTLLAMYNESLITMYSGYHPDHYWDGEQYERRGEAQWERARAKARAKARARAGAAKKDARRTSSSPPRAESYRDGNETNNSEMNSEDDVDTRIDDDEARIDVSHSADAVEARVDVPQSAGRASKGCGGGDLEETVAELRAMLKSQSAEIERLRGLVEPTKTVGI